MKSVKIGVFIDMLLMTLAVEAQNTPTSLWEENIEQLSMEDEEDRNWEEELREVSLRLEEPLNINTATKKQLEQFPFLSDLQIENILAYIYVHGPMQTIYELRLVKEMDQRTIELLLPFIYVKVVEEKKKYPSLKTILKYGKQETLARLDIPFYTRKGYEKNYLGPSVYHSLRYDFHYGDYLQVGITGEKDSGEPFFALQSKKGYDYYSLYFLIKELGRVRTLALGSYRLSFGQGLILSTDFHLGKSFSMATSEYRSRGIRKHSSTDEYNYFRGVASTVRLLPSFDFSAFYSHRSMDGVIKNEAIYSIYKTGLHRTRKEADKFHAFALQVAGGNMSYEKGVLHLGVTGIYYFMNHPYEPDLKKYAKYNLHGSNFYNLGMDYKFRLGRFTWTGEAALGKKGYALLNQLRYYFSQDYRLLLVHRFYAHDYWALFANSFSEGGTVQNENGWYLAMEITPWAHWQFFTSLDLFSFPWWRYRISKPSKGIDALFQTVYSPRKNLSMYFNYRYKQKMRDVTGTGGKVILPTFHHRFRYRLTYTPHRWNLKTTMDYNHFHSQRQKGGRGYQFTQACTYSFASFPFSVSLQGTYFNTDDYDSRVYSYEKGLLYTFYTPSFYGRGFRYSTHLRYDFRKTLMLLAKLGETVYQDRSEIGSGNDLIKSNKKIDLQLQLRVKF